MTEESSSRSIAFLNGRFGPTTSSCPTRSSKFRGRIRSASGTFPGRVAAWDGANKSPVESCDDIVMVFSKDVLHSIGRVRTIANGPGSHRLTVPLILDLGKWYHPLPMTQAGRTDVS